MKETTPSWRALSEWLKSDHKHFWVKVDSDHEPEIIWVGDEPNTFFCKAGLFEGLGNLAHKLALPIPVPEVTQ
jgi:hypothetical protein